MSTKPVRVLAIDPGEKCGWARADVYPDLTFENVRHGITPLKDFAHTLMKRGANYDRFVYEVFRLYPSAAQKLIGSDMQTAQVVGMIRQAAWWHGIDLSSQGAAIKKVARSTAPPWLQEILQRLPKTHDDAHDGDALLHLWYWAWDKYVH